jgi:hypothetical protein
MKNPMLLEPDALENGADLDKALLQRFQYDIVRCVQADCCYSPLIDVARQVAGMRCVTLNVFFLICNDSCIHVMNIIVGVVSSLLSWFRSVTAGKHLKRPCIPDYFTSTRTSTVLNLVLSLKCPAGC